MGWRSKMGIDPEKNTIISEEADEHFIDLGFKKEKLDIPGLYESRYSDSIPRDTYCLSYESYMDEDGRKRQKVYIFSEGVYVWRRISDYVSRDEDYRSLPKENVDIRDVENALDEIVE
jgi:hypothetical protein